MVITNLSPPAIVTDLYGKNNLFPRLDFDFQTGNSALVSDAPLKRTVTFLTSIFFGLASTLIAVSLTSCGSVRILVMRTRVFPPATAHDVGVASDRYINVHENQPPFGLDPAARSAAKALSAPTQLHVTQRPQEGYRTCWAACAEMVMDFHGVRALQCRQATLAFNDVCCTGNSSLQASGPCDKQWFPEFYKWGFESELVPNETHTSDALTWDEFKREIDEGRPFLFAWDESPLTHMLVAVGYSEKNGFKKVFYRDPLADSTPDEVIMIPFSWYNGSAGPHRHQYDYYGIAPNSFE